MEINRDHFLVFVAAMAACHRAPRARDVGLASRAATSVTIPAVEVAALPPPSTTCGAVMAKNQRILASPKVECDKGSDDGRNRAEETKALKKQLEQKSPLPLFSYCHEGHGTWSVVLVSAELSAPTGESNSCEAEVTYQLVYVSPSGESVSSDNKQWVYGGDDTTDAAIRYQLDLDGDGRDELIVAKNGSYNGGGGEKSVDVLQPTSNGLKPYPVGFSFDEVTDADGDGRPDFVNSGFFSVPEKCFGLYPTSRMGIPLLIHGLPNGTFTMSDDVARGWARSKCPTKPPPGRITLDPDDYHQEAACTLASCKRVWGESVAQITAGLPTDHQCRADLEMITELVTPAPPFKPLNSP